MADIWTNGYQEGFIDGLEWALKYSGDPTVINRKINEIQQELDEHR